MIGQFSIENIFGMGAEQSDTTINKYYKPKLTKEFTDYINGEIPKRSLRYVFFLMNANNFFKHDEFYSNVDIHKIADYIEDLGIIDLNEAHIILQKILQISSCDEVATSNLQIILPKMRIEFNDSYISPIYSKDLFNQLFATEYKTQNGIYKPTTFTNWNSPDILAKYQSQKQQTLRQIYENKYQLNFYSKDPKTGLPICYAYPVFHSDDLSTVVTMNYVENLYDDDNYQVHQGIAPLTKKALKPDPWRKNIHIAALQGDEESILYTLQLLPILLNCPDSEGNTPAHMAVVGDRPNIIRMLHNLGTDFKQTNINGYSPIHMCISKNVINAFHSIGMNLNERDANGNSLLELRTRNFNMEAIETLLTLNVNIFEPNPKGVYWMQFAIHDEYYRKDAINSAEFKRRVRKILQKTINKEMSNYSIVKEIVARQGSQLESEDIYDINESVTNKDINRIKALIALGADADRIRSDGRTNLMFCAETDDSQIAEILIKNFSDPNFKNKDGENTFMVASYMMNFKTAVVLRDNGANLNEPSSSGDTILHIAYKVRNMQLLKFLLDSGCDPNVKNKDGESVLFQAFSAKDDKIAQIMQKRYGGDINTQAQNGNTLAHFALLNKDYERLEYYVKRGIDIEIKNNYGYSLFMLAIITADDLQICSSLLAHGADINTQDSAGNTPLLNILRLKKYDRNKFDFLINNKCDINIKNEIGEYPISVCLIRKRDEEANILLSMNCQIHDNASSFEPIACSLRIKSQTWFEKMMELGSTASNTRYPILVNYINSDFFSFELMKKFPSMNVVIGGPIQAAMKKGYKEVVNYLWETSDEQTRQEMTKTQDISGMIPLSTAIVCGFKDFAMKLLNENYEFLLPDNQNRTPFSYACEANQQELMEFLFSQITLQNANLVDKSGNSALTYAAVNKNINFCNLLFVNDVDIFDINTDENGIIDSYQQLFNKFRDLAFIALDNVKSAESKHNYLTKEVDLLTEKIKNNEKLINPVNFVAAVADIVTSRSSAKQNGDLDRLRERKEKAKVAFDKYLDRYNRIRVMTRRDLIQDFALILSLAQNDKDIPVSSTHDPDFNAEQFTNKVFSIIKADL